MGKEKYLFDTTDCVHFAHVASSSHKLDANMGALINDLIPIVRKLRRIGGRVEFDVAGDKLTSEKEQVEVQPIYLHGSKRKQLMVQLQRRSPSC